MKGKAKAVKIVATWWFDTEWYNIMVIYASGARKTFTGYAEGTLEALWELPEHVVAGKWKCTKTLVRGKAEGQWWEREDA